ncbi:hypothetical protein D3C71_1794470 [compost metagenome]
MALEGHALLVQLAQAGKRHDLKTAAVGEDRMWPADQLMQAAKPCHAFRAGPQHQVIGIAENDIGPELAHLIEIHGLDSTDSANRHEGRCADDAARHGDFAKAGAAARGFQGKGEFVVHQFFRNNRLESP